MRTPNEPFTVGRLSLYILAAVVLLTACQRSISGTYLVSDQASVVWLELVRTPDNHLTGQLSNGAEAGGNYRTEHRIGDGSG
jgi:hypothetical protein